MTDKFKVVVAGGRTFTDLPRMEEVLLHLFRDKDLRDIVIISGTARGADQTGEQFAHKYAMELWKFPADWDTYGKGAGHIRNAEMRDNADAVVVFWDGKSRGSKNMIDISKKKGLPTRVIMYEES